jgi:hypothetical protein
MGGVRLSSLREARDLLVAAGFVEAPEPSVVLSGVAFGFQYVLTGERSGLGLIVLDDENSSDLARRVVTLGRALDVHGSRRSLTVVWGGTALSAEDAQLIEGSGRLLVLGADVRASVSILMPLPAPSVSDLRQTPLEELDGFLSSDPEAIAARTLLGNEGSDEASVAKRLRHWILDALDPEGEDADDSAE